MQKVAHFAEDLAKVLCHIIVPATQTKNRHFCKHVRMSPSATRATQNDMTSCLETFEQEGCIAASPKDTDVTKHVWVVALHDACHAKRGCATCETSKSDPCCRTCHRHGHSNLARMVANGWATSSEHTLKPQTPTEWNGNPCQYAFGKNILHICTNDQKRWGMGKMDQPSSWPKRSTESKEIEHPFAALQSFPAELSSSGTKALTLGPGLVPRPSLWEADQKIDVWCYPLDYTGLRSWKQWGNNNTH